MAITKTPAAIQPAFNEITVIDDENTSLTVTGIDPSPEKAITLHRVLVNAEARFNARALVSRLFTDKRLAVPPEESAAIPDWCFEDYNLKVLYSVGDSTFLALNAVRQIGESLDLYRSGESAILTHTHGDNEQRRIIPAYEGFPVGCTVMAKSWYEMDISNAFAMTLQITAADMEFTIGCKGSGLIVWGDNVVENYDESSNSAFLSHTYSSVGTYQIVVIPTTETILAPYRSGDTTSVERIKSVDRWNKDVSVTSFRNARNLESIPDGPMLGAPKSAAGAYSLDYYFYYTALTNIPDDLFSLWASQIKSASYVFAYSAITEAPSNLFAGFSNCTNLTFAFYYAQLLTTVGAGLFRDAVECSSFAGTFAATLALETIPVDTFSSCPKVTTFDRTFEYSGAITIPAGLFAGNPKVTHFSNTFQGATRLVEIPAGLFDSNPLVMYFSNVFANCAELVTIPDRLFQNNPEVVAFNATFLQSRKINNIPASLFGPKPKCADIYGIFMSVKAVSTLPGSLFDGFTSVVNATSAFTQMDALVTVEPGLLSSMTELSVCEKMFYNNPALKDVPVSLFDNNKKLKNLHQCFNGCRAITSPTPSTNGVRLWERTAAGGYVVPTSTSYCFASNTLRPDYAEIPSEWR